MVYFLLGFVLVGLVVSFPTEYDENVKIIEGYDIDIKDVPYQIALIDNDFRCGGSIISNDIIVTAAHCVSSKKAEELKIRAGSSIRNEGGELVQVEDLVYHPSFSHLDYDIAVLRLARPLVFSEAIQPVAMIEEGEEVPDGDLTLVTGWGVTEEHNTSLTLKGVKVAKVNDEACAKVYDEMKSDLITPRMLCAASPGKSACNGDSGGPLVHNGKLAGVVSFGVKCGKYSQYPGVFAKVSVLRRWVDETISDLTTKHVKRGI